MKKNMGFADRIARVAIAVIIAGLYISNTITGTTALVLLGLAAIFVLTSIVSFCPLYLPFKINTGAK